MKYRWPSPHDWLRQSGIPASVIVDVLLDVVDADTIQNVFQDDMDEDGYFDPLPDEESEP